MDRLTIVIPLKQSTHSVNNEVERFCRIGLRSLYKFMDFSDIDKLMIMCPEIEAQSIESTIKTFMKEYNTLYNIAHPPRIKMIHDPWLSPIDTSGWVFQQLLKLECSRYIYTKHYLVLDSDIYLTKPMKYRDLLDSEGRLLMTTDPLSYHPEWFGPSCKLLKKKLDDLYPGDVRVMQVTPEILVTSEVRMLLDWLRKEYGTGYQLEMLQKGFTEYSLYWSWLVMNHRESTLYQTQSGGNVGKEPGTMIDKEIDRPRLMGNALWFVPHGGYTLKTWVDRQFDQNQNYYFSLVQSNIKQIGLNEVLTAVQGYLS